MSKKLMKAYRILELGKPPVLQDVEVPEPGPGEVLIKMAGAGICRTDLEVIDHGLAISPWIGPFTLGHENAGWVEKLGCGVTEFEIGEAVVSCCMSTCGKCDECLAGNPNYCSSVIARGLYRADGGLAKFMIADQSQLIFIGQSNPTFYAPLTDAALSAYGAVDYGRCKIPPDGIAVVIGVGGLGYYAVQFLRELTGARIIAVDVDKKRLEIAEKLGADAMIVSDENAANKIMSFSGNKGAHAVFDFVGNDATMALCAKITRSLGVIVINGLGGGTLQFSWGNIRTGVDVRFSQGGTLLQLRAIVDLVRRGKITTEVQTFAFEELYEALDSLRNGSLRGRAVVVCNTQ